ncbi:MAG TPA: NifB/NifX family molybdenum-iron cluster-binding protein [Methanomassiliicoccales archaeon]|nr:NifB/NifX family molybdenum-iron cluster-binding protein [Methanomassiliicoccales archaeon]HNX47151.1 NifB/NifX family molybdenum-iron cluster-binding protein [Methanomassiliicoccales archaeon]HPR98802.1 NifB/NifX family molybdenum-iron cluster-binding protein [Methanomassiliicoccales archaeon]HSA35306.1 NifB/NifX family molybdenum-iron cluster-binding protein [Methanomassiliicoccales archaeon]
MKVAVTSSGPGTEDLMDDRLGRCPYFVIMDTSSGSIESFANPAIDASSGAGTKAMQALIDKGVEVVITGRIGPHAQAMLEETDLKGVTGRSGIVGQVLKDYLADSKS